MYNVFHKIWTCFVALFRDFNLLWCLAYPHEFFTQIRYVCITDNEVILIVRFLTDKGKLGHYITTAKHNKARTLNVITAMKCLLRNLWRRNLSKPSGWLVPTAVCHPDEIRCHLKTHWGRVTHICVSKLTIIASDNGLSPGRRQAIIWTNDGILLIWPLGTNFSEILIGIQTFSFKKMHLKMASAKWRSFISASMSYVIWMT